MCGRLTTIHMSKLIIALGAVIVLGGGMSFAAAQALPGDMLYDYKLSVNEKIGDMLAMSEHAKVERSVMLAERRLQEVVEASAKADVSSDTYTAIVANFNVHMKVISEAITKLDAEGRTDESKKLVTDIARVLTHGSQNLLAAQSAATSRGDVATGQSLDFIILNVTRSLTAAAVIATGQTTLE